MKVGVPREVKNNEYRVAITPAGVYEFVRAGHRVLVESGAGDGSSIGDADFHDGSILAVKHEGSTARVRVLGASGKVFIVDFGGVRAVRAKQAEGMVLYALSELRGEPPLRRFAFANWNNDSTGRSLSSMRRPSPFVRNETSAELCVAH